MHHPTRRNEGGGHPYLPAIYNNMAQIFQAPGYVVIYSEMIHFARVIPVDGRPALPDNVGTWLGDPRGRWEGNTLVVETRNFISRDDVGRTGVVYGREPRDVPIVERFTRVGPETINYEVTLSDPETWTRPFTIMVPWNKTNEQIYGAVPGAELRHVSLARRAREREKGAKSSIRMRPTLAVAMGPRLTRPKCPASAVSGAELGQTEKSMRISSRLSLRGWCSWLLRGRCARITRSRRNSTRASPSSSRGPSRRWNGSTRTRGCTSR